MTCRLSLAYWGVSEHIQMLRFLSFAGTYDQLDLSNLAVIEVWSSWEWSREGLRVSDLDGSSGVVR